MEQPRAMTRLRLTISIAGALAAVALAPRAAAAETCAPVARVSGDPALVEAVVAKLRARGIEVGEVAHGCGALIAVLDADENRVRVAITDADGRTIERIAGDADGAATAIETWARPELTDPLLAARPAKPPVHTALTIDPEPPPPAPPAEARVIVATAAPVRTVELFAAVEGGLSDDGALWRSVRAQACVTIRSVCAGAMLRHVADTRESGDAAALGSARSAFDILLIAERPWSSGRFTVAPGVGIGLSSLRAERSYLGADVEDEYDESGSLHLRASVAGVFRVAGAWAVRVDLALGASPWAPTQLGELDGLPQDEPPLAGVPRAQGWLGLGVAYGGL
jgi:hypothetical protein